MATIKSCTDIEQSQLLANFLALESADMYYEYMEDKACFLPYSDTEVKVLCSPCWSLSALLNVLPKGTDIIKEEADTENEKYMCTVGVTTGIISTFGNNPIDACYEMILKLYKLKKL